MNKKLFRILMLALILIAGGVFTYYYFTKKEDSTSLTKAEKEWIESNKLKLIDIDVENDIPVFNYVGEGVVFDFFKDFEAETGLEFNRISLAYGEQGSSKYSFKVSKKVSSNQIRVYEDNYVLLTLNNKKINRLSEIKGLKLGVLKDDLSEIKAFLPGNEFVSYASLKDMDSPLGIDGADAILDGIVVPKILSLKYSLNEKTNIAFQVNDLVVNYVIELGDNETLNKIIKKYYKGWTNENFDDEFNKYFTESYFDFKGIDQNSIAAFKSKRYVYGYIENAPFDVVVNNELMGSNKAIIDKFTSAAEIEAIYKKYDSIADLLDAFQNSKIDLFLNNTNKTGYDLNGYVTGSAYETVLVVISKSNVKENINSLASLNDKKVAVLKDSFVKTLLKAKTVEYKTVNELVKSKADIIVLDYATYEHYKNSRLKNYKTDYIYTLDDGYSFTTKSVSDNQIFNGYFDFYLRLMAQNGAISDGIGEILASEHSKGVFKTIALVIGIALVYIASVILTSRVNKVKQPTVSFKKSEKIKYMDMLTSLKNRNYLNDNIDTWEANKVYPQAIIIIDLNNIAYINDNYGHSAGDEEIKEAANVLIKNQVINSDIVRTNGNEFLIYLVGYKDKQIEFYIKKLNKELKELKHGFGASIGYSMILDDIKTIDDAINEATIEMRKVKEERNEKSGE